MNKMHRTLWNAARGCYVVAHEKAGAGGKPSAARKILASALTAAFGIAMPTIGLAADCVSGQAIDVSTTCTIPAGITSVTIKAWGAGGGGVSGVNYGAPMLRSSGRGGGGGSYCAADFTVSPADELTVTIGTAGTGGNATAGGNTSVSGAAVSGLVANGGSAGSSGGAGGTTDGCTAASAIAHAGGAGAVTGGGASATATAAGGDGAGSTGGTGQGNGGNGPISGYATVGTAPGGGGGGGDTSISYFPGKDGAAGRVIISYALLNVAPTASDLVISGTAKAGETLTGSYVYTDADSTPDAEGTSTFKWYSGSNSNGSNKAAINGATALTYQATAADIDKYLFFCVTPVAQSGTLSGSETCSPASPQIGTGVLSDVSVVPSSTLINATNVTYTLTYTTKNAIPYGFLLNSYFPAGVDLPAISNTDIATCSSALTVKIDNVTQDLATFAFSCFSFAAGPSRNGLQISLRNALPAGKTVSIAIAGVTNPATAGASSFTAFQTQAQNPIDKPATLPSITYTEITAPGQPTNVSVSAGDASATVSFTAPASDGGSEVTGYTATCDLEGNFFTSAIEPPHASGTSSPITVTGLTNGSAYKCVVKATNAIGTGDDAFPSDSFTPTAPPAPPAPPVNPFNPGGNSTVSDLNATIPGSTATYTPATSSLVTNLSSLENKVGVSDNGVVVITTTTNEPVKIKNDAPDNVLFSLPSNNAVNLQIGGGNIQVNTNTDPVKDNNGKSVSTVLATKTMTNEQGQTTQTVQVEKGQATVQSTQANQIVGGLTLSKEGTLRDVTATGGSIGSTVGFFKNPSDLSGSVSAESGDATVFVKLSSATTTPTDRFAADTVTTATATTRTLTLKAGEVARFDKFGELIGVYAGSLSGTAGKTGDALAITAPAGVAAYPKSVAKLDGNVLDRLGNNLLPSFLSAMTPASGSSATDFALSQDAKTGQVKLTAYGRDYFGLPLMPVPVDVSVADGVVTQADGTVVWTRKGVSVRFAPAIADLPAFVSAASQIGLSTQIQDDGMLKLSTPGTVFYARPRFASDAFSGTAGFAVNPTYANTSYVGVDGKTYRYDSLLNRATFTATDGKTQIFDPAVYDAAQINTLLQSAGAGWTQTRSDDGTLVISGPNGQRFRLLPDFAVSIDSKVNSAGKTLPAVWLDADGKVVILYNTGFIPMTQRFSLQ